LTQALSQRNIGARSHRPSRTLREEPPAQCLLTLAALAHPGWGYDPPAADVVRALAIAIDDLDLVRARLLAQAAYTPEEPQRLKPFERLRPELQERISYVLGARYDRLQCWLADYAAGAPAEPDHFLSRLFGEVIAQPGFGFHRNLETGGIVAGLIESARKFRRMAGASSPDHRADPALWSGREYTRMVRDGVLAAQYVPGWGPGPDDAVLLAPAHTFLMANRPVEYQFWLDIGSTGWWDRVYQPLTHPYVLSRAWLQGTPWTDLQEYSTRQDALYTLLAGLVRRCRRRIYLGLCDLGEDGSEQRGPLMRVFQGLLRRIAL
jgi:hypothetical protein